MVDDFKKAGRIKGETTCRCCGWASKKQKRRNARRRLKRAPLV